MHKVVVSGPGRRRGLGALCKREEIAVEGDVVPCNPDFVSVGQAVAEVFVVPVDADENSWLRSQVETLIFERFAVTKTGGVATEGRDLGEIRFLLKEYFVWSKMRISTRA